MHIRLFTYFPTYELQISIFTAFIRHEIPKRLAAMRKTGSKDPASCLPLSQIRSKSG